MPTNLANKTPQESATTYRGLIDPNNSKSASRYRRPAAIKMQLTDRDEQIITRCWEDKLLSTSDLHTLFFGARARCVERLRTLYSNHYLDRYFFALQTPYRGANEALYTIGTKGVSITSMFLEQHPNYVALKRREFNARMLSPSFLLTFRHLRAVISTRIFFEHAFAHSNDWQMVRWIPERLLEERFTVSASGVVKRTKIRADGFFQYQHTHSGHLFSAFVETDLGTMSMNQVVNKARRYLSYFQTALPEERFGTRWFRVLLLTTSQKRAVHLHRVISEITHTIFWLTSFDEMEDPHWLTKPIWQRAGREGRYTLFDDHTAD